MPRLGLHFPKYASFIEPRPPVNRWITPGWYASTSFTRTIVADLVYYTPILLLRERTFNAIGVDVTSAVAFIVRLGIYKVDDDLMPGVLVRDAGTVDVSTTGEKTISIGQLLQPGYYYLAHISDGTPQMRGLDPGGAISPLIQGWNASFAAPGSLVRTVSAASEIDGLSDPAPATTGSTDPSRAQAKLQLLTGA